jgi:hypothetical protein
MKNLASSQERLLDLTTIEIFKNLFISHGLPSNRQILTEFSELDRMEVVPLVFGLMPKSAIFRERKDQQIKPQIREHLISIGFKSIDEELVSVIKGISDQYYFSGGKRPLRKKLSISDIRMGYRRDYYRLRDIQNNRCRICGVKLSDSEEHLDHKIPFRLIGDVPTGVNWQLLCGTCNMGKSSYLSALQPISSQNWIYGFSLDDPSKSLNVTDSQWGYTVRFSILMQKKMCCIAGCKNTSLVSKLSIKISNNTGLPVIDNFSIFCEDHFN